MYYGRKISGFTRDCRYAVRQIKMLRGLIIDLLECEGDGNDDDEGKERESISLHDRKCNLVHYMLRRRIEKSHMEDAAIEATAEVEKAVANDRKRKRNFSVKKPQLGLVFVDENMDAARERERKVKQCIHVRAQLRKVLTDKEEEDYDENSTDESQKPKTSRYFTEDCGCDECREWFQKKEDEMYTKRQKKRQTTVQKMSVRLGGDLHRGPVPISLL
jgi:hypothetical protein